MIKEKLMITMIKTKTCPVERSSAFRLRKITGEKGSLPGVGGTPFGFEDENSVWQW